MSDKNPRSAEATPVATVTILSMVDRAINAGYLMNHDEFDKLKGLIPLAYEELRQRRNEATPSASDVCFRCGTKDRLKRVCLGCIGGSGRPEAQVEPAACARTLPCIRCDKRLSSALPEDVGPRLNQPLDGLALSSPGHYGTSIFDPGDGSIVEVNVCDPCLECALANGSAEVTTKPGRERPKPCTHPTLTDYGGFVGYTTCGKSVLEERETPETIIASDAVIVSCPNASDDLELDSPDFTPEALKELAARGYERINRDCPSSSVSDEWNAALAAAERVAIDEELWTEEPGRLSEFERRIVVGTLQSVARGIRALKRAAPFTSANQEKP